MNLVIVCYLRNKFPIAIQKCNKQKYQESFLQQYLRVLEAESIKDATPAQIPLIPTNVESYFSNNLP